MRAGKCHHIGGLKGFLASSKEPWSISPRAQRGGKASRSTCKEPTATSLRPLGSNVVHKSTEESPAWFLSGVDQRAGALWPTPSCGCQTKPLWPAPAEHPCTASSHPYKRCLEASKQQTASKQLLAQPVRGLMSPRAPLAMAGECQHALGVDLLVEGEKSKTRAGIWPRNKGFAVSLVVSGEVFQLLLLICCIRQDLLCVSCSWPGSVMSTQAETFSSRPGYPNLCNLEGSQPSLCVLCSCRHITGKGSLSLLRTRPDHSQCLYSLSFSVVCPWAHGYAEPWWMQRVCSWPMQAGVVYPSCPPAGLFPAPASPNEWQICGGKPCLCSLEASDELKMT